MTARESVDVAVIGGGLAGCAAALAAAEAGARVTLIDESPAVGGRLRWSTGLLEGLPDPYLGRSGVDVAATLATELVVANVELRLASVAWGLFSDRSVAVDGGGGAPRLDAQSVIVATGGTDVAVPFRGWDTPGVMLATAVRRAMHEFRVRPGTRAVVVGEGDDAADIVTELGACGISVLAHLAPAETHRVLGAPSVCQVESDNRRFDVDLVVVAAGRQPDPELASQVGCEMTYSSLDQAFVPRRDSAMRTSVPWVFAAGDSCGSCSPAEAWHEGRVAGLAATGSTGQSSAIAELDRVRSSQRRNENDISFQISDDTRVCRCEEIDAASIRAAIQAGARSVSEVKRWTRAGMGMCQGIYCTGSITALLRDEGGLPADSLEPMTARPPARVVPIAAFVDGWDES